MLQTSPNPSFRVGLDGYNLAIPRGTGIATYARSLSHCLHRLGHPVDALYGLDIDPAADPALQEVQFFALMAREANRKQPKYPSVGWAKQMVGARRGQAAVPMGITGRVSDRAVTERMAHWDRVFNVRDLFPTAQRYFRTFGRFVTVRVPEPPAIMHWTYPLPVRVAGARNIYTVHDIVPLRMPWATLDHKPTFFRLMQACIAQGDHICTVSDRSRDDIMGFFPALAADQITNTYQAVVPPPGTVGDDDRPDRLRDVFGLERRGYFLFFGSIEPKKNVGRLLEGFLGSKADLPLVIVGGRAWQADAELAALRRDPPDPRIRLLDYVPADALALLVRGARAVTFPSLYEGFGLPVLEAMAMGTPVLTSQEGSLPEVAGGAALLVDAYDPASIGAGLEQLAADPALCDRLAAAGVERARFFDMAHYQERVAAMYARVLGGKAAW